MPASYVVTGGGRGIGRAIAARLVAEGAAVVVIDVAEPGRRTGSARWSAVLPTRAVCVRAAELAEGHGSAVRLGEQRSGLRRRRPRDGPCRRCIRTVIEQPRAGRRGLGGRGAAPPRRTIAPARSSTSPRTRPSGRSVARCPTATAKAAVEGLTRALAVDEGPHGIRVNAVALGSITTERYERYLDSARRDGRRPGRRPRWRPSTRWDGSAGPTRSPTSSRGCSAPGPGTSRVRCCPSTAAGPRRGGTRRRDEPMARRLLFSSRRTPCWRAVVVAGAGC